MTGPSLFDRMHKSLHGRRLAIVRGVALAILVAPALVGLSGTWQARSIATDNRRIAATARNVPAARIRAEMLAASFARPTLAATLETLARQLPADFHLAAAARGEGGVLRVVIDTPDPDQLRAVLAGIPALGALRERAQDQREDGRFRVTLEARR